MKQPFDQYPRPNAYLFYAAVMGGACWWLWPDPETHFFYKLLPWMMALSVVGASLNGLNSLRVDYRRRKARHGAQHASGVHGNARFASISEMLQAGLFEPGGKLLLGLRKALPAFLPRGLHLAVQSPTGGGKTSALVIGSVIHALMTGRSVLCQDVKPEIAIMLKSALERMNFRVVINNPALVAGLPHNGDSNPLKPLIDMLTDPVRHGEVFIFIESIARTLIKKIPGDKNEFFRNLERSCLEFTAVAMAAFYPERCYPSQLWRTLTDPNAFRALLIEASDSDVLDGDLAAMANAILSREINSPDHWESGRTGAAAALSVFKPSSSLGSVGASHDFDPKDLRDPTKPPVVVFDIIPSDKIPVFAKVNAIQQTARLQALKTHREGRDVVALYDEATVLPAPTVVSEIELLRSYGVTICLFFQSWSSLERAYSKSQAESIRASCVEFYTGIADYETAELISKRIGDHTVKTNSYSFGEDGKPSSSVGETGKRLLPPEEILAMPKDKALVLVPGMRPVMLDKTPYFKVAPYKYLADPNPHEPHPPCPESMLTLEYGRGSHELGAPQIPGFKKKLITALKSERSSLKPKKVSPVRLRSFLWMPAAASVYSAVIILGTPHVIFEYQTAPSRDGTSACVYLGVKGFTRVRLQGSCPPLTLLHANDGDRL